MTMNKNDFQKIWCVLTPNERSKAIGMAVLIILMAFSETLGVISIIPFLTILSSPESIGENPILSTINQYLNFNNEREFILALGVTSIFIVTTTSIFKTISMHSISRFVHLLRHSISARLLGNYLNQPYEFFLTRNASALSKTILSEVDQFIFESLQPLSQVVAQGSVLLAMIVLIVVYDPLMAFWITFILSVFYSIIYILLHQRLARMGEERKNANEQRYKACNEALSGIKEVKITNSAEAYQTQFNQASRLYSRHIAASETLAQSPLYLIEAIGYSGLIIIALTLLINSNDVAQVLPALGLYGFAAYRMLPAAQIIYRGLSKLRFSSATLEIISRDLTLKEDIDHVNTTQLKPKKEIRLDCVHYSYPESKDKPIFKNFNLVIPVNESLGIVGKSGVGKSTLMDILLGLLIPDQGTLSIDGVTIDLHNVRAWQRCIGYVPQHIFLADSSVVENIAFGIPKEKIDHDAVQRAAHMAQIHEFIITELPQGYETQIGDRGIRLSGGQRQRLGIARALYHDPAVLILDEASSALDQKTEQDFILAMQSINKNKTIIAIAHHARALEMCSHIFNLEKLDYEH